MELGRPGVSLEDVSWTSLEQAVPDVGSRVEMKVEMHFRSRQRVLDFRNQRIFTRKSA
jgi:hypothetical protein